MSHTPTPWIYSPYAGDAIVAPEGKSCRPDTRKHYGGDVVAESVSHQDRPVIKSAAEMLGILKKLLKWDDPGLDYPCPVYSLADIVDLARQVVTKIETETPKSQCIQCKNGEFWITDICGCKAGHDPVKVEMSGKDCPDRKEGR